MAGAIEGQPTTTVTYCAGADLDQPQLSSMQAHQCSPAHPTTKHSRHASKSAAQAGSLLLLLLLPWRLCGLSQCQAVTYLHAGPSLLGVHCLTPLLGTCGEKVQAAL